MDQRSGCSICPTGAQLFLLVPVRLGLRAADRQRDISVMSVRHASRARATLPLTSQTTLDDYARLIRPRFMCILFTNDNPGQPRNIASNRFALRPQDTYKFGAVPHYGPPILQSGGIS